MFTRVLHLDQSWAELSWVNKKPLSTAESTDSGIPSSSSIYFSGTFGHNSLGWSLFAQFSQRLIFLIHGTFRGLCDLVESSPDRQSVGLSTQIEQLLHNRGMVCRLLRQESMLQTRLLNELWRIAKAKKKKKKKLASLSPLNNSCAKCWESIMPCHTTEKIEVQASMLVAVVSCSSSPTVFNQIFHKETQFVVPLCGCSQSQLTLG